MARPGLERHVKFKRLVAMLGIPKPHVRGYLETLWDVAYECGEPFLGDPDAVESAAEWDGEPGKLFNALLTCGGNGRCGFIEPASSDGHYQIHDLMTHAPDYVKKRKAREDERKSKNDHKNGGQRRTTADNGGHCQTTAHNGKTPAPAPAPITSSYEEVSTATEVAEAPRGLLTEVGAELLSLWNAIDGVVEARRMTKKRMAALRARMREPPWPDQWREAIARVPSCEYLLGKGDRGWRADIEFFLRPDSVNSILEGKYDRAIRPGSHHQGQPSPGQKYDPNANPSGVF